MRIKDSLPLIVHDWPLVEGNPKNDVLVRRRAQVLKKLDNYRRYLDMIVSLVEPQIKKGKGRLLEVGCGTGFIILELARFGRTAPC